MLLGMANKKIFIFCVVLLLALLGSKSSVGEDSTIPDPIKLMLNEKQFFWKLKFNNESEAKRQLKAYYKRIYTGELLVSMLDWIGAGSFESDYFISFYDSDDNVLSVKQNPKNATSYTLYLNRITCYSLELYTPILESIVAHYRIANISQAEFNEWLKKQSAEGFCLTSDIARNIELTQTDNGLRIIKLKDDIKESTIVLNPQKKPSHPAQKGKP
jgi:hypothetical protein